LATEEADTHEQIWTKETMTHGKLLRYSLAREQQNQEATTSGPTMAEVWRTEASSPGHKIVEAIWEEVQNDWSRQELRSSIHETPQAGRLDTEMPTELPEAQEPTILAAGTLAGEPIQATTAKYAETVTISSIQTNHQPHQCLEDVEALQTTHRVTGQTAGGSSDTNLYLIL